ncbi:Holliday junction resolvase RuvX [Rhodanobacter glycinis]|jgi:putative Holliday junction resolvase|uniref:Putative pre-16S rRNA nuclease n=1 Tax=Rhodanobacter glycinis TaxID=582702 RepID=A0A5B9E119_9GAMM|nr:Holliday junction resolvase RuvX [Rhodanobacter glycinis]QEE23937.1 Holliday junction resolvase RuvX [Rhodanobacter glycinis]
MSCAFGFDVGSKLIGVAVGNSFTASARGLSVLAMREDQPDWPVLDDLRAQWLPDTLVVGLPLTLDGAEQPASHRARRFAERLHARYELPVLLVDERHSSQEAAQRFARARAAGLKRRRDAAQIDAEAAAVILERWLTGAPALSSSSATAAPP